MEYHYCYILKNSHEEDKNRTYNGYTTNIKRRLRQHNGELKGGARYTKKYGDSTWEVYALIRGFPDKINALQCEWRIKKPNNKTRKGKLCTPEGRIIGLNKILKLPKWTNNSTIQNDSFNLDVWILNEYSHLLTDLPQNINIHPVDKIELD